MNTVGENIAALRKQKGFTQEALASAIGVSAQSVSKWENNTNMPDIMLLPIIADVFQVSIDNLFGRQNAKLNNKPEDAYDLCCDAMLETMMSCFYRPDIDEQFENSLAFYKKGLETDSNCRTGIIRKHGIVYYRTPIGGLILKKPESHWYELLNKQELKGQREIYSDVSEVLNLFPFDKSKTQIFSNFKTVSVSFNHRVLSSL